MPLNINERSSSHTSKIQDIITAPPSWILKWGISLFFTILVIIIGLSSIIRYPDIVRTRLIINSYNLPEPIISKTNGKLVALVVNEGHKVKQGQIVAYLESSARHEDVLGILGELRKIQKDRSFHALKGPDNLELGELGNSYKHFYNSFLLSKKLSKVNGKAEYEFAYELNQIVKKMEDWREKYVLSAPYSGTLSFNRIVFKFQSVKAGEKIFYIIPTVDNFFGEMVVPENGLLKVKVGQEVLIKLNAYPFEEYGIIKGKITYITGMPDKDNNYLAKVSISKQGLSDLRRVKLKRGMTANAEVVTKNVSVLSRITDNIQKKLLRN